MVEQRITGFIRHGVNLHKDVTPDFSGRLRANFLPANRPINIERQRSGAARAMVRRETTPL